MPRYPSLFNKGPIFNGIDQAAKNRAGLDLTMVLRELRSKRNLVDIGLALGIVRTQREEDHLRRDWFDETHRGWWRRSQPIEPIFRKGLIKAVELVRDLDLPIDAYWMRTGGRNDPVRVTLSVSAQQISFIFVSPHPQARVGDRLPRLVIDHSIWVVERDAKGRIKPKNVKSLAFER